MKIEMGLRERLAFEFIRVLGWRVRRQYMPLHIEFGAGESFRQGVAFVEILRLLDLLHQCFRHGGARLVVPRIVIEDARIEGPVFIEL